MTSNEYADLERVLSSLPASELPAVEGEAEAAGLLDVAYATLDSPAGMLLVASTPRGLVRKACL
jgi:hypothetical protein